MKLCTNWKGRFDINFWLEEIWHFTLATDHKPLMAIMGLKSGMSPLVAARLQRWAILLMGYHYDLVFAPQDSTPMLMHFCDYSEEILPLEKEQNWLKPCLWKQGISGKPQEQTPPWAKCVSTPWGLAQWCSWRLEPLLLEGLWAGSGSGVLGSQGGDS